MLIGNWIKEPSDKLHKLIYTPESGSYFTNERTIWQPQPGEWCWFWDHEDSLIVLQKFVRHDVKNTFRATDLAGFEFTYLYCEPFIGRLPTILQSQFKG